MTYFSNFKKRKFLVGDLGEIDLVNITHYSRVFQQAVDDITYYTYYTMTNADRLDVISNKLYGTPDYYWTFILLNEHIVNTYNDLPKEYNTDLINYIQGKYPGVALKLDAGETMIGKFNIGETVTSGDYSGTLLGKYPTLGYLNVEVTSQESFPLNQTFTLTGEESGSTVNIANTIEMYQAPYIYVDSNDNGVPWNVESTTPLTILDYEIDLNDSLSQIKVIRPQNIFSVVSAFEREMRRM